VEAPLGDSKDDVKQAIKVLQTCYPKLIVGHEVLDALKNNWIVHVAYCSITRVPKKRFCSWSGWFCS
jgi:hypothetical protein